MNTAEVVALFELVVPQFTAGELTVVSFRGREALSELFQFDVVVTPRADAEGRETELLGSGAELVLHDPRSARRVQGVIDRVGVDSAAPGKLPLWRVRLVPAFSLLRHRKASRIFQDRSVPEIIEIMLRGRVPLEMRLSRTYSRRVYCVQHRETDLAFVKRIAAEEGIAFCFADAPSADADGTATAPVIFLDAAEHYPNVDGAPAPRALELRADAGFRALGYDLHRFAVLRTLRPRSVLLRAFDFRRSNRVMEERAEAKGEGVEGHEIHHHPGHHDAPEATVERAQRLLEQERRRATIANGDGRVRGLAPGRRFDLRALEDLSVEGVYAITRVTHEGQTPEHSPDGTDRVYDNRFECVPAAVLLRPRVPVRKPRQALETAIVVGPQGKDVHTDEHGRVKVQFHWDVEGKHDDHSSAWLRVAQAWAGASFGAQFLPRIGMEVLVGFLDGNADHPVILGCLYNGTHPTPFELPDDTLKSGFRTQSSPGEGNSELSFHDKAGAEKVLLVAQRDLEEVVNHDHTLNVTGQQSIVVGGSRKDTVSGNSTLVTTGDLRSVTLASRTDQVMGTLKEEIGGSRLSTVHGSEIVVVKGNSIQTMEQEANLRSLGNFTMEIGTHDKPGAADVYAWGDYALGSYGRVRLRAQDGLVLVCGDSRIEITQKAITLHAQKVTLAGKSIGVSGDGPALRLEKEVEIVADKIRMYAKNASVELDEDASVNGKQVKLNCGALDPSKAVDDKGDPTTQHLSITLTDPAMMPYAGKDFILKSDGLKIEGTTDGDGKVEADVPKEAQTAEITLWIEPRPTGKTKRFVVKIGELPDVGTIPGVEARLRNLGYYWGPPAKALTPELSNAIKTFQIDHDLEPTAKPDAATIAKLVEVHGH